jgi:hypothetical protein
VQVSIQEATLLTRLIVEEGTLFQLPALLYAGREGVTHLALFLHLLHALQLLRARLLAHPGEQGTEDLGGGGSTGLWYRSDGSASLSPMSRLLYLL